MRKNKIKNGFAGLLLLFSLLQLTAAAQKDTSAVLNAVNGLEKAMIQKDTAALNILLHKELGYGHSNGWVQTKQDVINDMMSGMLVYTKLDRTAVSMDVSKEKAIVKERVTISGIRDGKEFSVSLFVLQVWLQNKKGWQMYARQGTKL